MCGSQYVCTTGVAANGAAPLKGVAAKWGCTNGVAVERLHCSCGSRGGCTAGVAADVAAPMRWQQKSGAVVATAGGTALQLRQPRGLRCKRGNRGAALQ